MRDTRTCSNYPRTGPTSPSFRGTTTLVTIVLNLPGRVVGQSDVIGLGTIETAESARMLILLDIERVLGGAHQEAPVEEVAI